MKRRTFILISAGAGVAVATPFAYNKYEAMKWARESLMRPDSLSHFCDRETIRKIGKAYRTMVPSENSEQRLLELLVPDFKGKDLNKNTSVDPEILEKRIREEFRTQDMVRAEGWVISVTEARQCALLSIS